MRHGVGCRFGENQSVKGAVEDVAHGSGKDQRESHDHPFGRVRAFAGEVVHQPADESDHHDPEDAQQQFAPVEAAARSDVHAEGRAVVLDESQLEPVGDDHDRFVEVHVGFDPDFERLVCNEQQQDKQRYFFEIHNYVVFRRKNRVYPVRRRAWPGFCRDSLSGPGFVLAKVVKNLIFNGLGSILSSV